MANPHGFTADAMPTAKANPRGARRPQPPSVELELPDRDSTNPFMPSMPLSLPMMIAPINAVASATVATTTGSTIVRMMLRSLKLIALLMG